MENLINTLNDLDENEIIKKWDEMLFLDTAKNKRNVALACELTAKYLLDKIEGTYGDTWVGDITTLSHPVIVRIFRNIETDLLIDTILNNVVEIINSFHKKLKEIEITDEWKDRGVVIEKDLEAEFVKVFCDNYFLTI